MFKKKLASAVLLLVATGLATNDASAVSAEIAKKCELLTAKAYPPVEVGNPALGSSKGTPQSKQAYFSKCVANGGKVDDEPAPLKK